MPENPFVSIEQAMQQEPCTEQLERQPPEEEAGGQQGGRAALGGQGQEEHLEAGWGGVGG